MSKSKTETAPPAGLSEFEAAAARWNEIRGTRNALLDKIASCRLAISMANNPGDNGNVPDPLRAKAEPYLRDARKWPEKLREIIGETELELENINKTYSDENDLWEAARRRETNRLALALQPKHRAAVRRMADAIEALSAAIADERECRAELRRIAPLPESPNLPDLSSDLLVGCVSEYNAPAWHWARRIRKMNIL